MFKEIKKHMPGQKENPAEHFQPSAEDKFPTLTQHYWKDPNSQKGVIEVYSCHGATEMKHRREEGV